MFVLCLVCLFVCCCSLLCCVVFVVCGVVVLVFSAWFGLLMVSLVCYVCKHVYVVGCVV